MRDQVRGSMNLRSFRPNDSMSVTKVLAQVAATGAFISAAMIMGIAGYLVRRITVPRRSHRPPHFTFTPWEFGIDYEEHVIPVDGSFVSAWLLPQENKAAPCIIGLSGFASHKAELLGIASNLHRDGFQMLLIDFRGTGRSPGDVVTMGHNETEDARSALDWLTSRLPDAPIGIIGFSMGASVALTLAATDQRIGAVVSDSAFAHQRSIFEHHIRRRTGLWPKPVMLAAGPMMRRRHGRSYDDFAPSAIVDRISPRPLLLIHPIDDQIVPFSHAEELWGRAREPKECWFLEGIAHCGAYFQDRPEYCRRVSEFFGTALK
jgi:uncharacterized protein